MGTTQAALRATLRQDLRDEDAAAYIWPDAVLNRHLQHAVSEVQAVAPAMVSLSTTMPTPATRRLDLSSQLPASALWIDAIEHPADRAPAAYLPFRGEDGPAARLLSTELPAAGSSLVVWYARGYTLAEGSSDLPLELDSLVLACGRALALADQAIDTVDKLTAGGAPEGYRRAAAAARDRADALLAERRQRLARPRWDVSWPIEDEGVR